MAQSRKTPTGGEANSSAGKRSGSRPATSGDGAQRPPPAPPDSLPGISAPELDGVDLEPLVSTPRGTKRKMGGAVAERFNGIVGTLNCIKGPEVGGVLPLEADGDYLIGRGRDNHLVIKDIAASRVHLRVLVENRQVRIIDQDSGNGTRINGIRVKDAVLKDGDRIELGNSLLLFAATRGAKGNGAPKEEAWMSTKTQTASPAEVEALRSEMATEGPNPRSGRMPWAPNASSPAEETVPFQGARPVGPLTLPGSPEELTGAIAAATSRPTVLVVLLISMAVLVLALSVSVALLVSKGTPSASPSSASAMVAALADRAVDLERAGDSTRADILLDEVRRIGTLGEYEAAKEKVDLLRVKAGRPSAPPEPTPAPLPKPSAAPPPSTGEPAKSDPSPAAPPPGKTASPAPAKHSPAPAKPKRMSNDEAKEQFQKAVQLMQDDQYRAAIRLCTDILDRADEGPWKDKARQTLPRWKKKLEDSR